MLEKKRERKKEMFLCRMRVLLNDESTKRVRDGNDFLRNVQRHNRSLGRARAEENTEGKYSVLREFFSFIIHFINSTHWLDLYDLSGQQKRIFYTAAILYKSKSGNLYVTIFICTDHY